MAYSKRKLILSTFSGNLPSRDTDESRPDGIIAFAFGNRLDEGEIVESPINRQIGRLALRLANKHGNIPIFAQSDVAQTIPVDVEPDVISISRGDDEQYLSTAGALDKIKETYFTDVESPNMIMVGHAFHVGRMALLAMKKGFQPQISPENQALQEFDAQSGQKWTQNRFYWRAFNFVSLLMPPESRLYAFATKLLPKN